jgi:hypothetical protein
MTKQFRPRGTEKDGMKYYQERNGDYLSVDPSTLAYYLEHLGRHEYEGRATAVANCLSSVCTTWHL